MASEVFGRKNTLSDELPTTAVRQNGSLSRRWLGDERLRFTGCSQYIADLGRSRGGGHWDAVDNFVDLESFVFERFTSADAPLLFLSRLERIKGVHNAIAIAKESGRRLIIAGNKVETKEGCEYWDSRIAPEIGRNRIEYVGAVDDKTKE